MKNFPNQYKEISKYFVIKFIVWPPSHKIWEYGGEEKFNIKLFRQSSAQPTSG